MVLLTGKRVGNLIDVSVNVATNRVAAVSVGVLEGIVARRQTRFFTRA